MSETTPPKEKKKKKKVWKIKTKKKTIEIPVKEVLEISIFIGVLFMLTFGTFWILQASLKTKTPMVVVISGSMEPTINVGDLLFIKGVDPDDIIVGDHAERTGDVIVFEANWGEGGIPVVHRVVDRRFNHTGEAIWEFSTWGDNNLGPDQPSHPWVREDDVVGIVVGRIPWVGYVKIFLTDYGMAIPLIIILALALVISIAWDLTHPEKEDDKEKGKKKPKRNWFKSNKEPDNPESSDDQESVNLGV